MKFRLLALALLVISPLYAADLKKGDYVLTAGWQESGPVAGDLPDQHGLVVGAEYMVSPKVSMRTDYFRASEPIERRQGCRIIQDPQGIKGYSLAISPHVKAWSFPIGLLGMDMANHQGPQWGGVAGAWIDFWQHRCFGIGLGANYLLLRGTDADRDFLDARAAMRIRFR